MRSKQIRNPDKGLPEVSEKEGGDDRRVMEIIFDFRNLFVSQACLFREPAACGWYEMGLTGLCEVAISRHHGSKCGIGSGCLLLLNDGVGNQRSCGRRDNVIIQIEASTANSNLLTEPVLHAFSTCSWSCLFRVPSTHEHSISTCRWAELFLFPITACFRRDTS